MSFKSIYARNTEIFLTRHFQSCYFCEDPKCDDQALRHVVFAKLCKVLGSSCVCVCHVSTPADAQICDDEIVWSLTPQNLQLMQAKSTRCPLNHSQLLFLRYVSQQNLCRISFILRPLRPEHCASRFSWHASGGFHPSGKPWGAAENGGKQ